MSDKFFQDMFNYVDSPDFTTEVMANIQRLEVSRLAIRPPSAVVTPRPPSAAASATTKPPPVATYVTPRPPTRPPSRPPSVVASATTKPPSVAASATTKPPSVVASATTKPPSVAPTLKEPPTPPPPPPSGPFKQFIKLPTTTKPPSGFAPPPPPPPPPAKAVTSTKPPSGFAPPPTATAETSTEKPAFLGQIRPSAIKKLKPAGAAKPEGAAKPAEATPAGDMHSALNAAVIKKGKFDVCKEYRFGEPRENEEEYKKCCEKHKLSNFNSCKEGFKDNEEEWSNKYHKSNLTMRGGFYNY